MNFGGRRNARYAWHCFDRHVACAPLLLCYHADCCSQTYQKAHWASGAHKKACQGVAYARRDTDREAQSRALARVAHMSARAGLPHVLRQGRRREPAHAGVRIQGLGRVGARDVPRHAGGSRANTAATSAALHRLGLLIGAQAAAH